MRIKGLFPTIKIGENTTLFVILEFSMFAFLGRKVQYILSLIVVLDISDDKVDTELLQ